MNSTFVILGSPDSEEFSGATEFMQNIVTQGELALALHPFSYHLRPQHAQGFVRCVGSQLCLNLQTHLPPGHTSTLGGLAPTMYLLSEVTQARGFHRPRKRAQGQWVRNSRVLCKWNGLKGTTWALVSMPTWPLGPTSVEGQSGAL